LHQLLAGFSGALRETLDIPDACTADFVAGGAVPGGHRAKKALDVRTFKPKVPNGDWTGHSDNTCHPNPKAAAVNSAS